jgi:streptomycin 6-kinase
VPSDLELPRNLVAAVQHEGDAAWSAWLEELPATLDGVLQRWGLSPGRPFQPGGNCSWVAPVRTADGRHLVLKLAYRHTESEHEVEGLQAWAGDGTVLVHRSDKDDTSSYLLLERCAEGRLLADRPEEEQDEVIAGLLRRLWVEPPAGHPFRPLSQMCDEWADQYEGKPSRQLDPGLARAGLDLFRELPASAAQHRLLLTDLHAENVLAAEREPWLVIDPKPYVGDPTYDPLQHLYNCLDRMRSDPQALIARMAGLCGVDDERLALWAFARFVVESSWAPVADIAIALAP